MMIHIYWLIPMGIVGYVLCLVRMSFDDQVVTLGADEYVVKKPYDGFVLAQVPPDVVREIVRQRDKNDSDSQSKAKTEARDIYRKKSIVTLNAAEVKEYAKKILPNGDQK